MARHTIEIEATFDLPRSRVFALFADHRSFGRLLGVRARRIRDSVQADPDGIGSVRRIGFGPVSLEETILNFEPDTLIEYRASSLLLTSNHHGRIRIHTTADGQTHLLYTVTFEERIPFTGNLLARTLEQRIRRGIGKIPQLLQK